MAAVSAKRKFQLCSITMKCQKPCTLRLSASIVPRKLLDLLEVSIAGKVFTIERCHLVDGRFAQLKFIRCNQN